MWVDALTILLQMIAAGLTFAGVIFILIGIKIWRTPTHVWEAERREILKKRKEAQEFYDTFHK